MKILSETVNWNRIDNKAPRGAFPPPVHEAPAVLYALFFNNYEESVKKPENCNYSSTHQLNKSLATTVKRNDYSSFDFPTINVKLRKRSVFALLGIRLCHERITSGNMVVCDVCQKNIPEEKFDIRIKVVHCEKKFSCDFCDINFCTFGNLKAHSKVFHDTEIESEYEKVKKRMLKSLREEVCHVQFAYYHLDTIIKLHHTFKCTRMKKFLKN